MCVLSPGVIISCIQWGSGHYRFKCTVTLTVLHCDVTVLLLCYFPRPVSGTTRGWSVIAVRATINAAMTSVSPTDQGDQWQLCCTVTVTVTGLQYSESHTLQRQHYCTVTRSLPKGDPWQLSLYSDSHGDRSAVLYSETSTLP